MDRNEIQSNKMVILGKLTASLIHEIRNPLFAIKINVDYLKMYADELPVHINESVSTAIDGIERIQNLLENLHYFTQYSTDKGKPTNINEVSKRAIDIVKGTVIKENLSINTNYDTKIPLINCNKNKLLQIYLNLLTNASDASNKNSEILIKSYLNEDGQVIWSISDNGIGINENDKHKVFEEFYTNKKNGTGLGLNVCKKLLEEMNAELSFESEYQKGTTFFITFNSIEVNKNDNFS